MSGPKSYSLPPSYSAGVFDGRLHTIFVLQAKIQSLRDELAQSSLVDKERNIHLDCIDFLRENRRPLQELVATFSIIPSGTFGQQVYDRVNLELAEKINQLQSFIGKLNSAQQAFQAKKEDYHTFISYESFYEQAEKSYGDFKIQVIDYLTSYLMDNYQDKLREAKEAIDATYFTVEKAQFEIGFRKKAHEKKAVVKENLEERRAEINSIRATIGDQVAKESNAVEPFLQIEAGNNELLDSAGNQSAITEQIEKIENFIFSVENLRRRDEYHDRLTTLIEGGHSGDIYYYIELFDEIKDAERSFQWKSRIQEAIADINKTKLHKQHRAQKNEIVHLGFSLIEKDIVKPYQYEDFKTRVEVFKEENEKALREDFIRKKERRFLKAQLIQVMEDLNYEVMDDMEVIDFEKESDFLLRIPNQDNYLNLRFNEDGDFLYNFLILENRSELSVDQKRQKIHEMETTCCEFKKVLAELAGLGITVKLEKEIADQKKALIQVPKKHQNRIKTGGVKRSRKKVRQQKQLKK